MEINQNLDNKVEIKCKMIAANSNTMLNSADYSDAKDALAYASANLIHIYSPKKVKTFLTLKGHKDRVNGVKWIDSYKNKNKEIELLSCSSDGTINHWKNEGDPFNYLQWKLHKTYKNSDDAKSSVNLLASLYISETEKYFACFSANGKLDIFSYYNDTKEFIIIHTISFKKKLQDALCLTVLNENYLLLISGGYDTYINIYTVARDNNCSSNRVAFKLNLQGHTNALRDISALCPLLDKTNEIIFASASQDNYIRLWTIVPLNKTEIKTIAETINTKGSLSIFDEYKSKTSYVIKTDKDEYFNLILESVLSGHEESVSSVRWGYETSYSNARPILLSSSFDFTVGIWKYDSDNNIWNRDVTLGEMVGNKHAFFSAIFIENNSSVLAYTYNGAFYLWRKKDEGKVLEYKSEPVIHGHFNTVSDLSFDPSNSFVITTSEDQTTRIFAKWKENDTWHEVNRPQIHGYDINTFCVLPQNKTKDNNTPLITKIAVGADEKIIRVFEPPYNIIKFLANLSDVTMNYTASKDNAYYEKYYTNIEGSKQALGLMTKSVKVDVDEVEEEEENFDYSNFNPDVLTNKSNANQTIISRYNYSVPPDEDFLTNNTLWPETNKFYGHGYEIIAIAASNDGKIIASGAKAQAEKHAKLFLWNVEKVI